MIQTKSLSKSFRSYIKQPGLLGSVKSFFSREWTTKHAVENFDLEVEAGEIVGLLGPNGAGKTTLMKMFTGIIVPSSGSVNVIGYKPFERSIAFRQKIALVMGQKSQLWWDIPALDSLHLLGSYYEIPESELKARIDHLADLLQVSDLLKIHVRKLSLGERMKMELMSCLLHKPSIIFLDEPTIGLDLVAQKTIRKFLLDYHEQHKPTIILTSHYMADVSALCRRIVLVLDGQKHFDGPLEEFSQILGKDKFVKFQFAESQNPNSESFQGFKATWNEECTRVEMQIPEKNLRDASIKILSNHTVVDFHTEKLAIERVMDELMSNPALAASTQNHAS